MSRLRTSARGSNDGWQASRQHETRPQNSRPGITFLRDDRHPAFSNATILDASGRPIATMDAVTRERTAL